MKSRYWVVVQILLWSAICARGAVIHVPANQPSIQQAINASVSGDTVIVAEGTWTGVNNRNLDFGGRAIVVKSAAGPETCVIDCQSSGRAFYFHTGEGINSVVEGFTIRNGSTTGSTYPDGYGGAIVCNSTSPCVIDCIFVSNVSSNYGGAMAIRTGSPTVINCVFTGNQSFRGGAVAGDAGAFSVFWNCLFFNNTAIETAGAFYCWYAYPELRNCTVTGNYSPPPTGTFYLFAMNPSPIYIQNSIFYGNASVTFQLDAYSDMHVSNSNIQGGFAGTGNIDADPQFVSGAAGNYYLSQIASGQATDSPCLNSGSAAASSICQTPYFGSFCMDEMTTRTDQILDDGLVDMGYHYAPVTLSTPTPTVTPTPPCLHSGDVDANGAHSAVDAQITFLIVLGTYTPSYQEECAADCNGDGGISAGDSQAIFFKVLGLGSGCVDPL